MASTERNVVLAVLAVYLLCSTVSCENGTNTDPARNTGNGEAVSCYRCNSHPENEADACADPIDREKMAKKKENCPSGICLKYVQSVAEEIDLIYRGCADNLEPLLKEKDETEGCILSTGTKLIQLKVCNCKGDDCNGATEMRAASSILLATGIAFVVARLLH